MVAVRQRDLAFLLRLRGLARQARDHDERPLGPLTGGVRGQLQNRLVEPALADRELRCVHAYGEAARAGVEVVARERPLAARIEPALGVERERMRGNHRAAAQERERVLGQLRPVKLHFERM